MAFVSSSRRGADTNVSIDYFGHPALSVAHRITGVGDQVVVVTACQNNFANMGEVSSGNGHGLGQIQFAAPGP